jgi:hypothetical protein
MFRNRYSPRLLFFLHSCKNGAISLFGFKETLISYLAQLLSLSATSPYPLNFSSALAVSTRTLLVYFLSFLVTLLELLLFIFVLKSLEKPDFAH